MENELKHYGVKGMKWGIRRYQNKDGTLTFEGLKRAKMEYKEDNQKAFELGKNATIADMALKISDKRLNKAKKKTDSAAIARAEKVHKILEKEYKKSFKEAMAHAQSLMKKYGDEAVKPIKYDTKTGHLKEKTLKPSTKLLVAWIGGVIPAVASESFMRKHYGKKMYKEAVITST